MSVALPRIMQTPHTGTAEGWEGGMREEDPYLDLNDEELDGAYWRWAEYAEPVRSGDGWVLRVTDGRIARWSVTNGKRQLSVQEWMYECFCAHFDGAITLERSPAGAVVLEDDPSSESAPLLELIGRATETAYLSDSGVLRIRLEDGTSLSGTVDYLHCEDRVWEMTPAADGWRLWIE